LAGNLTQELKCGLDIPLENPSSPFLFMLKCHSKGTVWG